MDLNNGNVNPVLGAAIQRKQQERLESFAKLKSENVLDEKGRQIVDLPVDQLLAALKSRQYSAVEVLRAYTAKAIHGNETFNFATEFIPHAMTWAVERDGVEVGSMGALHGLPVAIKEDHDIQGMDTTAGFAKHLYKPKRENSVMVKVLLKLGAVPFVKTNVPQSIFSVNSENPIFGTTLNSQNPALTPGGSSSGAGSIIGARCAPVATGSDIGGSLRIPAHCNGVASLRGTINRLSGKGMIQCLPKIIAPLGVPGIITPDVKTLVLMWRALTENSLQNQLDPLVPPLPWNESLFKCEKKLKFGYFTSLPFFPAFEETQKTVLSARDALIALGHEVVPFEMPDDYSYMEKIFDVSLTDQGQGILSRFDGEPVSECVSDFVEFLKNPGKAEAFGANNKRCRVMARMQMVKSGADAWHAFDEKRAVTQDMVDRMDRAGIDCILSPVYPHPATKIKNAFSVATVVYLMIWNFVDFPAGVLPFGRETGAGVASYDDQRCPILATAKAGMSDSLGMPIGVQIIARPFKEELVLRVLNQLEQSNNSGN